jgi:hypothetical protein
MRADASATLLSTFWDGEEPPLGPGPDDSARSTILERANKEALRLWQRMETV